MFRELINKNLLFTVKISNAVHDEYLLEAPKELGDNIAKLVENSMKKAADIFCKTIPLDAEAVISSHWEH